MTLRSPVTGCFGPFRPVSETLRNGVTTGVAGNPEGVPERSERPSDLPLETPGRWSA